MPLQRDVVFDTFILMNPKRLALAIVVVFIAVFATDFVIHGVWLNARYKETMQLWRPEAEMQKHFGWLMLGQFLATITFVVLWAKGFAEKACPVCAVMFGLFMALFSQANTLVTYAVQPMPADIPIKWFVGAVVQGVLLGLIVFFVYKPKPAAPQPVGA